jgi:Predicted sugar kinase
LTTDPETRTFIRSLVRECAVPFVLDADGLNAFAGEADALSDRKSEAVLTPHLGEFSRLMAPATTTASRPRAGSPGGQTRSPS